MPFLFDPETFEPVEIRRFCESQVEATGKEAGKSENLPTLSCYLGIQTDPRFLTIELTRCCG